MSLLPIGAVVPHYGKVVAVQSIEGERRYFLIDDCGIVSYMPADVIEEKD